MAVPNARVCATYVLVCLMQILASASISPGDTGNKPSSPAPLSDRAAYAIVIAITHYRDNQIPTVPYAGDDAKAVSELLQQSAGVPRENILTVTDAQATENGIRLAIEEWVPKRLRQGALLYVYFAGLGTLHPNTGQACLILWDSRVEQAAHLLPVHELYRMLESSGAGDVLVMLDTCFASTGGRCLSTPAQRSLLPGASPPDGLRPGSKVVALLASKGRETSLEYDKARHGLFTHYLLVGMLGEADGDHDGAVTVDELYRYVREQVSDTAWGQFFRLQTPTMLMSDDRAGRKDPMILTRSDRKAVARRHLAFGKTLQERGDMDGAIAEFREAVKIAPDDAQPHLDLGLALRDKGDVEGAITSYRMTLHMRPNDPDAHYLLGTAYSEKGQLEASIGEFREAIRLRPGFDVAHNNLGHVLEQKGDLAGAIAEYRMAVKLRPLDPRARYNLGSALKDRGDLPGAVAELKETIRLKPDHVKAHYHLGVALSTLGETQESERILKRFLQLAQPPAAYRDMVKDAKARLRLAPEH
jgi:Flp pilus assembly protein TadD